MYRRIDPITHRFDDLESGDAVVCPIGVYAHKLRICGEIGVVRLGFLELLEGAARQQE